MTKEEKAKAYDEALGRAKDYYKANKKIGEMEENNMLSDIFPELAESEDEKIRKALINVFATHKDYEMFFGVSVENILAWLEKQGETYTKKDVDNAYLEGMAFAKDELEKQGGQKPQRMISAEAKEALYDKPAEKVEPKCEESKTKVFDAPTPFEDKLYAFVAACEFLTLPSKIEFIKEHSQELLDAAKEQIEKEETEWTKEDEHTLQGVIDEIQANKNQAPDYDLATYDRFLSWLKSLKPQNRWKPSDAQMASITCAVRNMKESACYDSELVSLLNDLKKL